MPNILTVNAGSSTVRLGVLASTNGVLTKLAERQLEGAEPGVPHIHSILTEAGVTGAAVAAHRVVHGGAGFAAPALVTPAVEAAIAAAAAIAPLHNPAALAWLGVARTVLPLSAIHVAVFDTAFFADLPPVASDYALPRQVVEQHRIRRYGFHGIAHRAMSQRLAALSPQAARGRTISLQLGAGCSAAALRNGKPLDTSMGFSPLEGLVMATRSGDIDAGLLLHLQREAGLDVDGLDRMLSRESGLLGLSGTSGDMRTLLESETAAARHAVDVFVYRARKYVGAYLAVLGGADAIVFGGGVGEHAPAIRARILDGMAWAGIELDRDANQAAASGNLRVSAAASAVEVWVIPVDEAEILAREAMAIVAAA